MDPFLQFLHTYQLTGVFIGIATFLIIGFFHPVVIKAEYYCGTQCWWVFLLLGVVTIGLSIWVQQVVYSSLLGVFGFSSLWTIGELFEQKERVEKGWFPPNPNKVKKA